MQMSTTPSQTIQPAQYQERQKLKDMADNASEVLITATAVFPFDFFPNSITVDRSKVTLHKRIFFGHADAISVQIEDLLNAEVETGPLFATLKVYTRIPNITPLTIRYLPRKAAIDVQNLLEGFTIARAREIDCSAIPRQDLARQLIRLGHEAGQVT
jgi:hypothetical protein